MSGEDSGTQWEPSHLRSLLTGAGVGGRHGYRELARQSGHRLSREYWRRLVLPIPAGERGTLYAEEDLRAVAETLRKVGETITFGQIERAFLADRGYKQAVSGDDLTEVLARVQGLSHSDQLRLIQEVALLLAPDGDADHSRTSAKRTGRER
jgi:hypothetical protein